MTPRWPEILRHSESVRESGTTSVKIVITGWRYDEKKDWLYVYKTSSSPVIRKAALGSLIRNLDENNNAGVVLQRADDTTVGVAKFEIDGQPFLASYANGDWTTDLNFGLPIVTEKPLAAPAA